ncbi:MAG: hypothetical protein J3R72DRAFT_461485 [Linnemannia gamsii]|nr:MAG: hypothetical protein J3R72DRAFT_461485 [Linnemannia gamsii]
MKSSDANPIDTNSSRSRSPSPSRSSGSQEQHHHHHNRQHYNHSQVHNNQAQTLSLSRSLSIGQDSAAILITPADQKAGASDGGICSIPPDNYIAKMIFEKLLPEGPMMYGRRSDANCILLVGRRRYFVHVQMLCSRSSTFNRIINEMMVNHAWGPDGFCCINDDDYKDDADGDGDGDDVLDLENDDPAAHNGHFPSSGAAVGIRGGGGGGGASNAYASTSISTITTAATTTTFSSTSMSTTPIAPSSIVELNSNNDDYHDHDPDSSVMDEDEDRAHVFDVEEVLEYEVQEEEEEEDEEDDARDNGNDDEENDNHPTLTLKLSKPVSSRFDEMLYWIYTNQSDRWRRSFTPENYHSILHNIALLHLVNPTVLGICRAFEADHQALQGAAEEFFVSRRLL